MRSSPSASLSRAEYEELADFRYQIRRFLHFSEGAAVQEGIEPRQHQALIAIKAMPPEAICTIGTLAHQLLLQHQSTVGLVDRMERRGLVARIPAPEDGRQVIVVLTRQGEDILNRLSLTHHAELEERAPELARSLQAIMRRAKSTKSNENS
jgi:DNA-binding MarR family transcriptional regulator